VLDAAETPLLDLNRALISDIEQLPGVSPELAEAIFYRRETTGYFESIFDLRNVPGMTPEVFLQIRPLVRIEIPADTNQDVLEKIERLQSRLAGEDGVPSEMALDQWEDLLIDPMNVNEATIDELTMLDNVSLIDAAAIARRKWEKSHIQDSRSLRRTAGLSYYGYRNMRDYLTYTSPPATLTFHGNYQVRWQSDNLLQTSSDFGIESMIEETYNRWWEVSETNPGYIDPTETTLRETLEAAGWSKAKIDAYQDQMWALYNELNGYRPNGSLIQKLRGRLGQRVKFGFLTKKAPGEESFTALVKGYASVHELYLRPKSRVNDFRYGMDKLVVGNYRLAFGQGLTMDNTDEQRDRTTDRTTGLFGDASSIDEFQLRGAAGQFSWGRLQSILFLSQVERDAVPNFTDPTDPDDPLRNTVNTLIVASPTPSMFEDQVEETTSGGYVRLDLGRLWKFPIGTRIGFLKYQSHYNKAFVPDPYSLDIPDSPIGQGSNELEDPNYLNLWSGNTREVLGVDFQTVISENYSLEGEFSHLQGAEDGNAVVLKARAVYDDIYLLAIYRRTGLGYDNPYSRPFKEQRKFDDTQLEREYRLLNPVTKVLEDMPYAKAEEGIYLETRYQLSRSFTITKMYIDLWKNRAYDLANLRFQTELEYRPIFPLRFRLKWKHQEKQRGRPVVPTRSITDELTFRVFCLITENDFFQIEAFHAQTNVTSSPTIAGDPIWEDGVSDPTYIARDELIQGHIIGATWERNLSPRLSVKGWYGVWGGFSGGSVWHFEDIGIDFLDGRGTKYYVTISDRLSDQVQLRLKFRAKHLEYPHTNLIHQANEDGIATGSDQYHFANGMPIPFSQFEDRLDVYSVDIRFDYRW